ncbi:MAG: Rieske 2Fe-2S domain-containing protein [Chloroflexi bacterium]|nr:Rieske 2Fe-2S domain-containing protein [Chloroflexota bacterium]
MAEFERVAGVDDVPDGGLLRVNIGSWQALLAKVTGRIYAFQVECPHEGTDLDLGDLDGTTVTCMSHYSDFDVTSGAVLGPPAESPLVTYPVRVEGNSIFLAAPEA